MQWDDTDFAGFSNVEPWLKVNPNYKKNPDVQAMALVNEDIFLDSILGYCKYNKESDSFIKLNIMDLIQALLKYFKYEGYELTPEDVSLFTKQYYPRIITKTGLASKYNKNKVYKEILEDFKEDYKTIKAIIDKFE